MNPVVHFEMQYDNDVRMMNFYQNVFGWKMQTLGEKMGNYILATTSDKDVKQDSPRGSINGGFFPRKPDWPAQYPSIVIAVEHITESMKKVADAGGKVLGEPMEITDVGTYVSFIDTEGNRVSMLQPKP
jgi:predicted enzyme related to lactoylglutathione lyase